MTVAASRDALEKALESLIRENSEVKEKLKECNARLEQYGKGAYHAEEADVRNIAGPYFDPTVPPESEGFLIIDPIYGSIRIEGALTRLVRHGVYARLDSIRQLAFVSIENANATHTRQAHSYGVSRFCEMAVENFLREDKIFVIGSDKIERFDLDADQKQEFVLLAKACGLLHDIGHAPFGHNLDRLVSIKLPETNEGGQRNDKYFSAFYIKNYVSDTLKAMKLDPEVVISILCPSFGAKPREVAYSKYLSIIKNVVDSDLDVDRIDYLIRDSMSTGLGLAYMNVPALINGMRPVVVTEDSKKIYSLAYDERIISHVEHAIYARHAMYEYCYETDTRLACECMLVYCINYFLNESRLQITDLVKYGDEDLLNHVLRYSDINGPAHNLANMLKLGKAYETLFRQPTNPGERGGTCKVVDDFIDIRGDEKISDPMIMFDDWRNKIVEKILPKPERWKVLVWVTPPDRYEQTRAVNLFILKKTGGVYSTPRITEFKPRIGNIVMDYTTSMPSTRVFANRTLSSDIIKRIRTAAELFFKVEKKEEKEKKASMTSE